MIKVNWNIVIIEHLYDISIIALIAEGNYYIRNVMLIFFWTISYNLIGT